MHAPHTSRVLFAAVFLLVGTTNAEQIAGASKPDREARTLALRVHREAAIMDSLPRYYYRNRVRVAHVDTMRDVEGRSVDLLKKALDEPVREEDWQNPIVTVFAWDKKYFLHRRSDPNSDDYRFWTRTQAWRRYQRDGSPPSFTIDDTAKEIWEKTQFVSLPYIEVTPHEFWWGDTTQGHGKTSNPVPPDAVAYRDVGTEQFGGEVCDVVEAISRGERLWIGRKSGRLRGMLRYIYQGRFDPPFYKSEAVRRIAGRTFSSQDEYQEWYKQLSEGLASTRKTEMQKAFYRIYFESNARPHMLVRFDDYREVAPGVWIPFREVSSHWSSSRKTKGKYRYVRSEIVVEEASLDIDLTKIIAEVQPMENDRISDRRFGVPVSYKYRANRTREEILKLVSDRQQEIAESQRMLKQYTEPIEAMVGKPAPDLPEDGWIGAERPELEAKPYLLHFWATWCAPCKNDLPILKRMAESRTIIGIHPSGTPTEQIQETINEEQLNYPTVVANVSGETVNEYPVKLYPYSILVDASGRVVAHGTIRHVLEKWPGEE